MKKLLLLLMLVPFTMFAKFYDGTINLNDGSSKTGLIEIPSEPGQQNLKYKTDLKAKAENISINDIKDFDITDGNDKTPTKFIAMNLAKGALFGDCKVDKKKSWVRIEKEGKITLYSSYIGYRPAVRYGNGNGTSGWPPQTYFYLGRPGINYATFFWMYIQSGGGSVAINNFKVIKRLTKSHFENNCPTLESFIEKDDFKTNGITRIVDLYEEHCGK